MFSTIKFNWYYINFQLPFQRSSCGFDTLDLDLDLAIDPQFKWTWKDEAEYWAGIREGGILDEWVRGIERAKDRVFERIKQRADPLNASWLDWRPDPGWAPPGLPEHWDRL